MQHWHSLAFVALVAAIPAQSPYSKWSNGPSTDPNHFPIGVWLQSPGNAAKFKALGVNTFIGLWNGPTASQLATLHAADMPVIAAQNGTALSSPHRSTIWAWAQQDEPDIAQPQGSGWGPPIPPSTIISRYQQMRSGDSTRPVFLNFGPGVANENWAGRGTRAGHLEDYPEYIKGADIISFDIYPVTESDPLVRGKLEYVAKGVERLVQWANGQKVVWNFVECTHVKSQVMPTPDDVRAEVWMSLIHGSQGILYFVHEWYPTFAEAGVLKYPQMVTALKSINAQIHSLAPVLNSKTIAGGATVSTSKATVPVAHMVKRHGGATWLFAVGMRRDTVQATFTMSGLPSRATATVIGGGREVAVVNGVLRDDFAPYGVHLYRIVPETITATPQSISVHSGGVQALTLDGGPAQAGRHYWIFGSASGTFPGVRLGAHVVPLNPDAFTDFTIGAPNTVITGSLGQLDAQGRAQASFKVPAGLGAALIGTRVRLAYVTFEGLVVHSASNPTSLRLSAN